MLFSDRVNTLTFVLACQVEDEICQVEDDVCQVEDDMHDKLSDRKCFHLNPYPFESVRYLIPKLSKGLRVSPFLVGCIDNDPFSIDKTG